MLFITGCCNTRYYVIGNAPDFDIKKISQNNVSISNVTISSKNITLEKVRDFRIYITDSPLQEIGNFEILLPYAKSIYKHTQPIRNHKFVDEVKMEQVNDSIVVFQFSYSMNYFARNNIYLYHIKEKVFTFTSVPINDKF